MNVTDMRNLAREALASCGARGFVRFAPEGGALLVTDAALRCADGGAALRDAVAAAGFVCRAAGALLALAPGDALLSRLCARAKRTVQIDWDGPLHPAQTLAAQMMRAPDAALTDAGRALIIETARLLWRPRAQVLAGLPALRARRAALLRERDTTGFAPAGALLANWCDEQGQGVMQE